MNLKHHKAMPKGPELQLEEVVFRAMPRLFAGWNEQSWVAGSARIGAGLPDILTANWKPEVVALANSDTRLIAILSYLRGVSRARLTTIANQVKASEISLRRSLDLMIRRGLIKSCGQAFAISAAWRRILSGTTSIEVKVRDWRKALAQARRNQLFVERSYIAVPRKIALKIKNEKTIIDSGVGVLSVAETGRVVVSRRARTRTPQVWNYYFRVAALIADEVAGDCAVRYSTSGRG